MSEANQPAPGQTDGQSENEPFDLVVLGAGPGGYVAAIRAAQLGFRVAVVDENDLLGGTCLRVGCIPSKALLESSHHFVEAKETFASHGIVTGKIKLDLPAMLSRKDEVVKRLTGGVKMLLDRAKIKTFVGRGRFDGPGRIKVEGRDAGIVQGKNVLIAVGSYSTRLPNIEFDGDLVGDSTTALSYPEPPKKLVVIGAGYIGLELGSVWNRLGSEVVVLEALDRILPGMDSEIANIAKRTFEKQGIQFRLGARVESVKVHGKHCVVTIQGEEPFKVDRVLVAVGRTPATKDLGLETIGLETDARGRIAAVEDDYSTAVPGVYAIGDCIGGPMLAHKASEEGVAFAEKLAGIPGKVHYEYIPGIVYTHPEIATVGVTEDQAKASGHEYKKGICPFGAVARAVTLGDAEGRVKILADAQTDRVLGVHIIGPRAGDLIAEAVVAMQFGASSEDIARVCHAHPTLSEGIHEAALAVDKRAIHT
jgi:dihydrolipoamide dehydrogenase